MACSTSLLHFPATRPSLPPTSARTFPLPLSFRSLPSPLRRPSLLPRSKFEKFGPPDETPSSADAPPAPEPAEDEDSDLPSDLQDSVRQSARAAALFLSSGGMRSIVEMLIPQFLFLDEEGALQVEMLIPQFLFLDEEGAQAEMWESSRIFLETLLDETGRNQRVKAIFPDAGAAALLSFQWKDATFGFSSLSDRKPVDKEDEIVVMILPDHQMLEYVQKIASNLSNDMPKPLIMWNPRLVSEDVGVGFNVRNLRKYFLSTFTTVYSMRPLPSGAVFRCYPGMWKVFYDDKDRPNRYLLAKEQPNRPDATELELIFGGTSTKSEEGPSFLDQVGNAFSSLSSFMKVISK